MIKKLKNLLCCLSPSKPSIKKVGQKDYSAEEKSIDIKSQKIEIDIDWEDINKSTPKSKKDSIISKAMRRNGYYGYSTECILVLDNGEEYVPNELTEHWHAFLGSPKVKPTKITYHKLN
jgi:hypothetical protein